MAVYQDKAKERIRNGLRKFAGIAERSRHGADNEADTRLLVTAVLDQLLGWDTFTDISSEQCMKGQCADSAIYKGGASSPSSI